ncbi:MAG: exbD [Rickettsiaceae bacterium]|jgi:biopolymer transport protein ExbD|nr:exbD [Rickettsiaceae bacterium]
MQFKRNPRKKQQISLIPMINIIFLLLVFFIIAGTIEVVDTFDLVLPKSQTGKSKAPVDVVIYLSADGKIAVNSDVVTEQTLQTIVKTLFIDDPKQQISIKSDASVPAKTVITVMNLIEKAGGSDVSLITQTVER